MKPLVRRQRADEDVREAIEYFLEEASSEVAAAFVDGLEHAYLHVERYPSSGSLRYAHELDLPGLRFWMLERFPYLVFYVEGPDTIDVWRVLHGHRDIPEWLRSDT